MQLPISWRKIVTGGAYLLYLVTATSLLLLMVELALWKLDSLTPGRFPVLATDDYPAEPAKYIKVAVFGESSAVGQGAERGPLDIIRHELKRRFPGKNFYFRNYARPGACFHGYQARLAKANMARYDVIVLYAGHNEAYTKLDATGFFRKPGFESNRQIVRLPGDDLNTVTRLLDYHSRIYALLVTRKKEALSRRVAAAGGMQKTFRFSRFAPEAEGVLPPADRGLLADNYAADMKEIAALAKKAGKQVVAMVPVANSEWPPCFSLLAAAGRPPVAERWQELYQRGEAEFRAKRYGQAVPLLKAAYDLDPGVAAVNYLLGISYKETGQFAQGRSYLRRASDLDGYTARALSSFTPALVQVAQSWPENFHVVDGMNSFDLLLARGYRADDLFNDIHHPSFAGYVVVGRLFAETIARLPLLQDQRQPAAEFDVRTVDLMQLAGLYRKELKVTPLDTASVSLERAGWFVSFADYVADPEDVLRRAELYLNRFLEVAAKSDPEAEEIYRRGREVIEAKKRQHGL